MLTLFEPKSKVQKDRRVIRQTDERLVKYSRRGLITHFLVYLITLVFGDNFVANYQNLAILLTVGLLIITAARGYFLFRFDSIYPRGPKAWRNQYFNLSLMSAGWWSLILACVTLTTANSTDSDTATGMALGSISGEALLLWLYTIVFFSTTSHALAPYARFLTIYQYLGLIPATLSVFFIGDFSALLFGSILFYFVWILNHQSELISKNYWDNLDAQYMLARKTQSLEEEKRDTRASVALTNDYLYLLNTYLNEVTHRDDTDASDADSVDSEAVRELSTNVDLFQKALTRDLDFDTLMFNVRHYLQNLVSFHIEQAEREGVYLETSISPALPMRLVGDPLRLGQILNIMLDSALEQTDKGTVFVEVELIRELETTGQLHVTLRKQAKSSKKSFFNAQDKAEFVADLDFVLAKALSEAMGGSLDMGEGSQEPGSMHLRLPSVIGDKQATLDYHRAEYKSKSIILVNKDNRWLDQKRLELDALGFDVITTTTYKSAYQKLIEQSGQSACTIIYTYFSQDEATLQFCQELLAHERLQYTNQMIICSRSAKHEISASLPSSLDTVKFLPRPAGIFEFDTALLPLFTQDKMEEQDGRYNNVLWINPHKDYKNAERLAARGVNVHTCHDFKAVTKLLQAHEVGMVVCETAGLEAGDCITQVRTFEADQARIERMPIVAIDDLELRESLYCAGVDHVCDSRRFIPGGIEAMLVWAEGRFH